MPYLCIALVLAAVQSARAHPLGNDSITHFNVLYVLPDRLEVDFLLDVAENPTQFIETNEMDANRDGRLGREEQEAWLEAKVGEYAAFLAASVDGKPLELSLVPEQVDETGRKTTTSKVIVPMLGPMGMTYRIVIRYRADYPVTLGPGEHVIRYEDKTYPQHMGLKLVLLEPPPLLCRLYDIPDSAWKAGSVPAPIVSALADEALPLGNPDAARLEPAPPGSDGHAGWDLVDGDRRVRMIVGSESAEVRLLPYCELVDPQVPLVSEDNAAFRYEQYDPVNLPDNRKAEVRFVVVGDAALAVKPASQPGRLAATRVAGEAPSPVVRAMGEDVTPEPSQPTAALPAHASDFLDPNYNPVQSSNYQRQAEKMVGLLREKWSPTLFILVTGLAFAWGAIHALMPGHAKTVVAAYLISQRGTYRHAAVLAVIVTVTHTALVVIMGLVIWFYQRSHPRLAPTLQLWLGLVAGLLVAAMGLTLLWRAATGRLGEHDHDHHHHHHGEHDTHSWWRKLFTHSHPHVPGPEHAHAHDHGDSHVHPHPQSHDHTQAHAPGHSHDHAKAHEHVHVHADAHSHHGHVHAHSHDHAHPHDHEHSHGHHHDDAHVHPHGTKPAVAHPDQLTFRTLLLLGVTGGIVPCPSATIIMFLGIGANVVGGALYAIAVFSLGLALTLMAIGSLALVSRRYAAKVLSDAQHEHELSGSGRTLLLRIVPALSGLAVVALGGMIATHYIFLMRGLETPFPWMG